MKSTTLFAWLATNVVATTAVAQVLSPPTNLNADVRGTTVTVSWSDPNNLPETTYVIRVGSVPGASNIFVGSVGSMTSASGSVPAGTYYWRVIAVSGSLSSPASVEANFSVGDCAPTPPRDLTATVVGNRVTLQWLGGQGGSIQTNYLVEAGSRSGSADVAVFPIGGVTTFGGDAPPGQYYVRIRAQNACGLSHPSNEQIVSVGVSPCTSAFAVSPRRVDISHAGGVLDIGVNAPAACGWQLVSQQSWIIPGSSPAGTGPGAVRFLVEATAVSRFASVTTLSGGVPVAVTEITQSSTPPPPCSYRLSQQEFLFNAAGGSFPVTIDTLGSCPWNLALPAWVSASRTSGAGATTVQLSTGANANAVRAETGVLFTSGGGNVNLSLMQAAGSAPLVAEFTPTTSCQITFSSSFTAGRLCRFDAGSSAPNDGTLSYQWTIAGIAASGRVVEGIEIPLPTAAAEREVTLVVRNAQGGEAHITRTILFLAPLPASPLCTPGMPSVPSQSASASGGVFEVRFSGASPGCGETSTWVPHIVGVTSTWIQVLGPVSFRGGGTVQYNVAPNLTGADRIGAITFVSSLGDTWTFPVLQSR
jgi:hypothetical protein